jgi:tRNA G18 (ribose-2'-O)-methylase SpoU
LIRRAESKNLQICKVSHEGFETINDRDNCDGLLGLANFWNLDFPNVQPSSDAFILIAEGIGKAGNLGALMRSAESAGFDALIVP